MMRLRVFVCMCAVGLVCIGGSLGQDSKKDATKSKGQLPAQWGKLGLTDEQKQKIYGVQATYRTKIQDLESQIKELRNKEKSEMTAVLTDAQKTKLRELLLGDAPVDSTTNKSKDKDK